MMKFPNRTWPTPINRPRSGQVLIEFAFIVLILYILLAVSVDFGRALYSAQIVQQAADVAARELSRTPLSPTAKFNDALADSGVQQRIYSKNYLVVTPAMLGGQTPVDYFADKPIVNQILLPVMINQTVSGENWLTYPGQLIADSATPSGNRVVIPVVDYSSGTETIVKTVEVLEEILTNPSDSNSGTFSLLSATTTTNGQSGLVALRINCPFQAAGMTAFQPNASPQAPVVDPDFDDNYGPYAGPSGLGAQAAFGQNVRPFRRLISAQAIYRREIFQ